MPAAVDHVTCELGTLLVTLLPAQCQVWLPQARLPENCKKTLRVLPIVLGQLFGPNISELLENRIKLSMALSMEIDLLLLKGAIEKVPPLRLRDAFLST